MFTLNVPKQHNCLVTDNTTLLHEMIHQYLFEGGEPANHDSDGWRQRCDVHRRHKLALCRI